jgi:formylglycine-generating enzyme required for sulfatase activity
MELALIPAGEFMMGSDKTFDDMAFDSEMPLHRVTVSKPFYLGRYEVTQAQWEALTGGNPSRFKGRDNPVEQVSWDEVQIFISILNEKERPRRYRLPTEAEWEYAARAGSNARYSFGDNAGQLGQYAWYEGNSGKTTHPVGRKRPNAWGLYDMQGNVCEWVGDWYDQNSYSGSPSADPQGPPSGSARVLRGGGWDFPAGFCRPACRNINLPGAHSDHLGFRLALPLE